MIDITDKPTVQRAAKSVGGIKLRKETIELIKAKEVEKGDVFESAKVAAIMAVKKTSESIPYCHPIPVTFVGVEFEVLDNSVSVEVEVKSSSQTGVEMEALCGVSAALLTIWDMVKMYEKDAKGQYPDTRIENIRVLEKVKG